MSVDGHRVKLLLLTAEWQLFISADTVTLLTPARLDVSLWLCWWLNYIWLILSSSTVHIEMYLWYQFILNELSNDLCLPLKCKTNSLLFCHMRRRFNCEQSLLKQTFILRKINVLFFFDLRMHCCRTLVHHRQDTAACIGKKQGKWKGLEWDADALVLAVCEMLHKNQFIFSLVSNHANLVNECICHLEMHDYCTSSNWPESVKDSVVHVS